MLVMPVQGCTFDFWHHMILIRIVIYIVHVKELELQCIATFCIPPHTVTQAMDSTVHSLTSM